MFERFTHPARQCMIQALAEAHLLCHDVIDGKHLLLGLMRVSDGVAAAVLADAGLIGRICHQLPTENWHEEAPDR